MPSHDFLVPGFFRIRIWRHIKTGHQVVRKLGALRFRENRRLGGVLFPMVCTDQGQGLGSKMKKIPIQTSLRQWTHLNHGEYSRLMKAIIEEFTAWFVPNGVLVYARDAKHKQDYFNAEFLAGLNVNIELTDKMPDVVIHHSEKNWLFLVETIMNNHPISEKRQADLARLFASSTAGLIYVTAFPERSSVSNCLEEIAWGTEVWVADAPSHLIHFNGVRFLGPHANAP
jgi:BsuBI/PstI restriction endonuclease domain